MLDHQGQISIPATAASRPVFVSAVVSYSLAYAADVMDNDNLATALEAQIQISIALMGTVRKPSIDPIVLVKIWGITLEKAQKTIQVTTPPFVVETVQNKLLKSSSPLPGASHFLRNDVCQYKVQKWQQMPPSLCHRLWMAKASQWHPEVKHTRPCSCCL